jgi:general secretion pathway protein C
VFYDGFHVTASNLQRISEGRSETMVGKITLPAIIALLLILALTFRLGMAGKVLIGANPAAIQVRAPNLEQTVTEVDLARIQALGLFDSAPGANASLAQAITTNADQTALNLQLEGVLLAGEANRSAAILVVGGKQSTYKVGETLPVGNRVQLESVHNDHVIINNDGVTESLWLYDAAKTGSTVRGISNDASAAGNTADLINRLRAQRTNAPAVAATLSEIIQVTPAFADGEPIGYRLSPGAKLKEFVQLGFKENDVVTSVNGIALDDMRNLPQLYSLMNEATEVSFSLLRDGQPQTLQISLAGTP